MWVSGSAEKQVKQLGRLGRGVSVEQAVDKPCFFDWNHAKELVGVVESDFYKVLLLLPSENCWLMSCLISVMASEELQRKWARLASKTILCKLDKDMYILNY